MRVANLGEKRGEGRIGAVQVFADLGQMVEGRLQVETGLVDSALCPCEGRSGERGQGFMGVVQHLGKILVAYGLNPRRRNILRRIIVVHDRGGRQHGHLKY